MAKMIINKKVLSALLALIMVFNLVNLSVFAAEMNVPAMVENFQDTYYKQNGAAGSASDWELHLSKTATPTNEENVYDITLTVETKDISTQLAGATHGAVALVLDVSSSMAKGTGTCGNCGKAENHSDHRGSRKVCNYREVTHLALLKEAVKSFLDSYAATAAEGDKRLVAIVKFATNADTVLSWIDVSDSNNLTAVKNAVDAMNSVQGTNIEAGLVLGRNLLNMSELSQIPLENQSLILFSDGSPTVSVGNVNNSSTSHVASDNRGIVFGNSPSNDLNTILAAVSAKKKAVAYNTDADLLNSVFGAANVITSSVDSLALDLTAEAGKIVTSTTDASTVTDPMGTGISMVTVTDSYNAASQKWDLSKFAPAVSGGITTYTITYRVRIDPMAVAADQEYPGYTVLTPANGATTLNYTFGENATPVSVDFNEPNVRGIRSFTVSYVYEGNIPSGAPAAPAAQTYKAGQVVQVADAPALENYIFSGWSKTDFVMPAEDVVIIGSWSENAKYDYSLTYNANFGANETKADEENISGTYATSHAIEVNENSFQRANYTFIGWNTQADGKGTAYAAGETVALTAEENTEILYAQWQEHPKFDYEVIYNANFGANETKADEENISGTYATSHAIEVNENSFQRANHTFIGWNTQADGKGTAYAAGETVALTAQNNTEILYAQWQENPKYDYEVKYNANFGLFPATAADEENVFDTYATSHTIEVNENPFERANHTFIGWSEARRGEVVFAAGDQILFTEGGEKTLYAQWIEHDKYAYTVIYNGNGGETAEGEVSYGDSENVASTYATSHKIAVDENGFVRENYTFTGWNTQADGKGTAYSAEDVIALTAQENTLTLYAQWQENPKYDYAVTYNANFGEEPETAEDAENISGIYDVTYQIEADANRFEQEGYTFIGWNTQADGKGTAYSAEDVIALTAQENTLTLYAQWRINEYEFYVRYMVRIDDGAYNPFAGQLPEDAPVGGKALFGTVLDETTLAGIPAALTDSSYTYGFTALEGVRIPFGSNTVTVYYTYVSPEEPVVPPTEPEEPVVPPTEPEEPVVPPTEPVATPEEPVVPPTEPVAPPVEPPVVEIPDEPVPQAPAPVVTPEVPVVEIPDEPVPQAAAPAPNNSGLVELPDEDVPLASVPKTGDPIIVYAAMCTLSGLGLLGLNLKKKEEEEA